MKKIPNTPENIKKCICGVCPSFNQCSKEKGETLFCADEIGKGKCEYKMNGCICGACPIYPEYNLKKGYYCINGSAQEFDEK
jgi:hypothetical protein